MTNFDKIKFDPRAHTYKYEDVYLMPVTSVLKWLTPPFDTESALAAKAFETGKTKAQIQCEWDAKRDYGLERGTRVHAYAEMVLNEENLELFKSLNEHLHEMQQFDAAWNRLQTQFNVKVYKQEWTIGDCELGIAGRCDAILNLNHKGGVDGLCMFDWKTGKFMVRKHARESMLPPFDDLPCCEEIKYSMQVSLYRLIIRRNTDLKIPRGLILHLPSESTYQFYKTLDLSERLEEWILTARRDGRFGDPELEKCAARAAKPLDGFNEHALAMLSPESRRMLLTKAAELLNRGKNIGVSI